MSVQILVRGKFGYHSLWTV